MTTFESVSTDHFAARSDPACFSSTANVYSQLEANPFIKHDLAGKLTISFDKFVAAFSGQPSEHSLIPDPEVSRIAQGAEIVQLSDLYCICAYRCRGTISDAERLRYGPFVDLANAILKLLSKGEEPPICFTGNDPHNLMGVGGKQHALDVVVLNSLFESVKDGKWKEYSNQNSRASYDTRWTWIQVLFTLKFKLSRFVIELTNVGIQYKLPGTSQLQLPPLPTHSSSNDDDVALGATSSPSTPAEKWLAAYPDVSFNNCVSRHLADGSVAGVLNGWDLSKSGDSTHQSSKDRTGTRPFMAIDLLVPNPLAHLERYDWESIMYVIIWIACRFERGGHETNREALKYWLRSDLEAVRTEKISLFYGLPVITGHYAPLRSWISQLLSIFRRGNIARVEHDVVPSLDLTNVDKCSSEPFDDETLGGHVTYEALWAVLSK